MAKRAELELEEQIDETEVSSVPRVYELGFHLDPELPTEEVKKAYQAVRETVAAAGEIVAEREPEKVQLAYTISRQETGGRRDFDSAYFAWIVYEAATEAHAEVVSAAGANKKIVRFIDLVTTKDAARHALDLHELSMKVPERASDPEAAATVELDAALENLVA